MTHQTLSSSSSFIGFIIAALAADPAHHLVRLHGPPYPALLQGGENTPIPPLTLVLGVALDRGLNRPKDKCHGGKRDPYIGSTLSQLQTFLVLGWIWLKVVFL